MNFRATWEEYGPPIETYAPMNPSGPNILPSQQRDSRLRLERAGSESGERTPVLRLGHLPGPRPEVSGGPKPPEGLNLPPLPIGTMIPHTPTHGPPDFSLTTAPIDQPPGFGSATTPHQREPTRITETRQEIERKYLLEKGLGQAKDLVEKNTEKIIRNPLTLKEMTRGQLPKARADLRRRTTERRKLTASPRRGTRRSSPTKMMQTRPRARRVEVSRGSNRARKIGSRPRTLKAPRVERKSWEKLARTRARSSLRRLERLLKFAKKVAHVEEVVEQVTGNYRGIRKLLAGDFTGAFTEFRSVVVPIDMIVDLANYAGFESLTGRTLDEYIGGGHAGEDLYYLTQNFSFREIAQGAWTTFFGD